MKRWATINRRGITYLNACNANKIVGRDIDRFVDGLANFRGRYIEGGDDFNFPYRVTAEDREQQPGIRFRVLPIKGDSLDQAGGTVPDTRDGDSDFSWKVARRHFDSLRNWLTLTTYPSPLPLYPHPQTS